MKPKKRAELIELMRTQKELEEAGLKLRVIALEAQKLNTKLNEIEKGTIRRIRAILGGGKE